MIRRKENWQSLLSEFINAAEEKQFSVGKYDCCLFAADCIKATTGIDCGVKFTNKYRSESGANRIIKRYTVEGTMESMIDRILKEFGWDRIDVKYARRGDVVYTVLENGPTVGICVGIKSVFLLGKMGLRYTPTLNCTIAWGIG